jgi:hypothetical protein
MALERNTTRTAALIIGLSLGLGAPTAQSSFEDAPVWLVADHRLTVKTPTGSGALPLYLSKDWDRPQPAITRAIVTIHGLERAASNARTIAEVGRAASKLDPESVLLIEPQFLNDAESPPIICQLRRCTGLMPAGRAATTPRGPRPSAASPRSTRFSHDWRTASCSRP